MTQPLVSGSWYRVAPLKPSLVADLRIIRHKVRDQVWHVLVEPGSGRQLRLNPAAFAFAGRCDGHATVEKLWQQLLESERDDAPTQDDILRLLAQLFRAGMVQFDAAPYLSLLFSRRTRGGRAQAPRVHQSADAADEAVRSDAPAGPAGAAGDAAGAPERVRLVGGGGGLGRAGRRGELPPAQGRLHFDCWRRRRATRWPGSVIPWSSSLHEVGHGMAVRRFGGAVHDMGISLLFLTPAPYVDASAANGFASARQRAVVSAAGIMVELALAALAVFAWAGARARGWCATRRWSCC